MTVVGVVWYYSKVLNINLAAVAIASDFLPANLVKMYVK